MADKGIIFSAPMVRALLDGRKTQTRRLATFIKPQADGFWHAHGNGGGMMGMDEKQLREWGHGYSPYAVGDRLYVREACRADELAEDGVDGVRFLADDAFVAIANNPSAGLKWLKLFNYGQKEGQTPAGLRGKGVPSIHMPRWASRMWLAVTDVRVQRLQECSEVDAIAEGLEVSSDGDVDEDGQPVNLTTYRGSQVLPWIGDAIEAYADLWDQLHTAEGEHWQDNPWVVAVSFDVHLGNIDEERAA